MGEAESNTHDTDTDREGEGEGEERFMEEDEACLVSWHQCFVSDLRIATKEAFNLYTLTVSVCACACLTCALRPKRPSIFTH